MEMFKQKITPKDVFITTLSENELINAKRPSQVQKNRLSGNEFVDKFVELLSIHKAKRLSFYEAQMGLQVDYLLSLYSKTSFIEWRNQYLMLCAKELLLDTDYTLDKIGKRLGFSGIYVFSKWFIQLENQPPSTWRKIHKSKKALQENNLIAKLREDIRTGKLKVED